MTFNQRQRAEMSALCGELREDDGVDPRDLFKPSRKRDREHRKAKQLCRQVQKTLDLVLSGEIRDESLSGLKIVSITPGADSSRLMVTVVADVPAAELSRSDIERWMENERHFAIVAICNLERFYTFVGPHYVLIPAPKTGPQKLVFRGPVGMLIQVRKAAEFDEGFHPQIGEPEGPCGGSEGGERGTKAEFRLTSCEIHTDVPLSTHTPTNYGQTRQTHGRF